MPIHGSGIHGAGIRGSSGSDAPGVANVPDNGDLRIQYRKTGGSWPGTEVVISPTSIHTISSLDDGESYDVRARTETPHVTGAWSSTQTKITPLPAVDLNTPNDSDISETQIDLSWTINDNNADGYKVFRAERIAAAFGSFQEIADLGPTKTSYSDTTAPSATALQYYIQAYTEHVTSDSNTIDVTTSGRKYWLQVGEQTS